MKIESEISPLKKVILHRPDISLRRLTPHNCQDFLFDDVLWPHKAGEEHDVFSNTLREHGVEVFLLVDLLRETLEISAAKNYLIDRLIKYNYYNTKIGDILRNFLMCSSSKELTEYLIGGLTVADTGDYPLGLLTHVSNPEDFILPPLPNHLFTRDTSAWIGNGVSINSMKFAARHGETINIETIYQFHPMFTKESFNIWYNGAHTPGSLSTIEGGDILVINKNLIVIGIGQRTKPQAIEMLAKNIFNDNSFAKILAIKLPKQRISMHLDTVMAMLNHDTFCIAFPTQDIQSWVITPGNTLDDILITEVESPFKVISEALGEKNLNLIKPGGDEFTLQREQWTDASNLLAIKPGTVIGYECNVETNKKIKAAGIEIITIPGSELGRGRGGSRCMSCPLERE